MASNVDAKIFKKLASSRGNNFVNRIFKKLKVDANIGTKSIKKIAAALRDANKDLIGRIVDKTTSNIPAILCDIYEF